MVLPSVRIFFANRMIDFIVLYFGSIEKGGHKKVQNSVGTFCNAPTESENDLILLLGVCLKTGNATDDGDFSVVQSILTQKYRRYFKKKLR